MTCLHLSSVSVDWNSAIPDDHQHSECGSTSGCFLSSVVYVCTSYSQLVECRKGDLGRVVDLPFNDGILVKEIRSAVIIVQSLRNSVVVVDSTTHQV